MTVDSHAYRHAIGAFATGVSVLTTGVDGEYHAVTINSLTSVSLEPTLLLVCLDYTSRALPVVQQSGVFNVNILTESQEHLSRHFASKANGHDLDDVGFEPGVLGAPVLSDCLACLECRVVQTIPAGDHLILMGEVDRADVMNEESPLLFHRGKYGVRREVEV